ncbi:MAG: hypothetical protein EBZ48_12580, partial [Proteobacteria bacterium]|nr:hypothetical protein [Pseudomonadota bacterium]
MAIAFERPRSILLLGLALLILTQCTRFSSSLRISVRAGEIRASVDDSSVTSPITQQQFSGVRVQTQHSMTNRSILSSFTLQSGGQLLTSQRFRGIFIFGLPFPAPADLPSAQGFRPSFGDWTQDRYGTEWQRVFDRSPGDTFDITATFLGRGDHYVVLEGTPELRIYHRDGFMDNDFTVCYPERCLYITTTKEPVFKNILRLLNGLFEGALVAVLIAAIVEALNGLASVWVKRDAGEKLTLHWRELCERISRQRMLLGFALGALVIAHIVLGLFASRIFGGVP